MVRTLAALASNQAFRSSHSFGVLEKTKAARQNPEWKLWFSPKLRDKIWNRKPGFEARQLNQFPLSCYTIEHVYLATSYEKFLFFLFTEQCCDNVQVQPHHVPPPQPPGAVSTSRQLVFSHLAHYTGTYSLPPTLSQRKCFLFCCERVGIRLRCVCGVLSHTTRLHYQLEV